MFNTLRRPINRILGRIANAMGYDVRRIAASGPVGRDPFWDMSLLHGSQRKVVIFDVGANVGQSIERFRCVLDDPSIHSFEPSRDTFSELQKRTSGVPRLRLNCCALGSSFGQIEFGENTHSEMSSILEPRADCWGAVKARVSVAMRTIDDYCAENNIGHIDIIKSDTQGFDLEVLKGAERLLSLRRVHMVFTEVIFSDMYANLPRLDDIYGYLANHGFRLVSFYAIQYQNNLAGWTDALFVNPQHEISNG